MSSTKHHLTIVPFWPLTVHPTQNYFTTPAQIARKLGFRPQIFVLNPNSKPKPTSFDHIPVHSVQSTHQLSSLIPPQAILHYHTLYRHTFAHLLQTLIHKQSFRLIWTPHTSFAGEYPFNLPLDIIQLLKPLLMRLDHLITISPFETDYYHRLGFHQTTHLPLPINHHLLKPSRKNSCFELLFFGGDRPVKGLSAVLQAHHLLQTFHLNFKLHILGNVNPNILKHQTSHLIFHGHLPPLSKKFIHLLHCSTIYINNSSCEGTPLAAYEATRSNLGLILSNLPTLKSIFHQNALYHPPDNFSFLAKNILHYYYNQDVLSKHTKANQPVIKNTTHQYFSRQYTQILKEL